MSDDQVVLSSSPALYSAAEDGLLSRARANDTEALSELYRTHVAAARRVALSVNRRLDVDDVANEAFIAVMTAFASGHGPVENFRGYFFTAVRHEAERQSRRAAHETPVDVVPDSRAVAAVDGGTADRDLMRRMMGRLSREHAETLWSTAVEGETPSSLSSGTTAASTLAALAYRAREGLRRAYLVEEIAPTDRDDYTLLIPEFVRGKMSRGRQARMTVHLANCTVCAGVHARLIDVDRRFS